MIINDKVPFYENSDDEDDEDVKMTIRRLKL